MDGRVVEYTRCAPERWRGGRGYFELDGRTRVVDRTAAARRAADYGDIEVGQTVRAIYRGAVAESHPTRGKARSVVIFEGAAAPDER